MTFKVKTSDKPMPDLPTGNERILVVDDDEMLAILLSEILKALGYEVVPMTRSLDALELFRSQPDRFDLVLTDLTMPGITGIDLAVELQGIRSDVPIILCTGFTSTEIREKAIAAGIRQVVTKPYLLLELAETVRRVLDF